MSPECRQFLFDRLGITLEQLQGVVASASFVDSTTVHTPISAALFPRLEDSRSAFWNQREANRLVGHSGATLAQHQFASPGTHAYAQYGGSTVFYNPSYFAQVGSALAFYTVMHEGLHLMGMGDRVIQSAFGITVGAASANITIALMATCAH